MITFGLITILAIAHLSHDAESSAVTYYGLKADFKLYSGASTRLVWDADYATAGHADRATLQTNFCAAVNAYMTETNLGKSKKCEILTAADDSGTKVTGNITWTVADPLMYVTKENIIYYFAYGVLKATAPTNRFKAEEIANAEWTKPTGNSGMKMTMSAHHLGLISLLLVVPKLLN